MADIWHPEPAPGAITIDLTRPGSLELVIELHRLDEHRHPTGELDAVIRLDPFAKLPKRGCVRPPRTHRRPAVVTLALPIFNVQHFRKDLKKHVSHK